MVQRKLFKGGIILNIKIWKLWLFTSICFLFVSVINLIDKNYLLGSIYTLLGVTYIFLSISYYKKDTESNKIEVSDTDLKSMDIELKNLIAEGKKIEAVKRYREITGISLKKSKEYIDSLVNNN